MKGKNKISWKIWIIIILGVLALAGVSYLIYDHFINMDAVSEENKPGDNLEGKIYSLDEFLSLLDGYWDNLDRPGENIIVKFPAEAGVLNEFVKVKIERAANWAIFGRVVK